MLSNCETKPRTSARCIVSATAVLWKCKHCGKSAGASALVECEFDVGARPQHAAEDDLYATDAVDDTTMR